MVTSHLKARNILNFVAGVHQKLLSEIIEGKNYSKARSAPHIPPTGIKLEML